MALHNGLTPGAALRRVAVSCLQQLEANAPGALTSADPEYVHQMRVALRRLRSAMRLFDDTFAQCARKRFDTGRDLGGGVEGFLGDEGHGQVSPAEEIG